jgi:hypothetical protein
MVKTKLQTRAANPHRKKLTAKQIKFFGTARQRAGLKAARKRKASAKANTHRPKKHRVSASHASHRPRKRAAANSHRTRKRARSNPKTRTVYKTKYKTRIVYKSRPPAKKRAKANSKRKRSNPGPYWLLTAGPVNPHRRKSMTKRKRASAKSSRRRAKSSNPHRHYKKRATARSHRHSPRGSRNPFGQTPAQAVKFGGGILLGVFAAKKGASVIGGMVPQAIANPWMAVLTTGAIAFAAGWAAHKWMPGPFAVGVWGGGIAQTINVAINALSFGPLSQFALSGMGDFAPAGFPLPTIPVRAPMQLAPPAQSPTAMQRGAQVTMGAWGSAW